MVVDVGQWRKRCLSWGFHVVNAFQTPDIPLGVVGLSATVVGGDSVVDLIVEGASEVVEAAVEVVGELVVEVVVELDVEGGLPPPFEAATAASNLCFVLSVCVN